MNCLNKKLKYIRMKKKRQIYLYKKLMFICMKIKIKFIFMKIKTKVYLHKKDYFQLHEKKKTNLFA